MTSLFTLALLALPRILGMHDAAEEQKAARFKVTLKRDNDKAEVTAEPAKALFSIRSPFGISQAVIDRVDGDWPESVVVRLHLKGLSNFRATNGKATVEAAVSLTGGKLDARVWKDGQENAPLDRKNPYWIDIRAYGENGQAAQNIPLANGYFEFALPRALFEGNPPSITVSWIDFYRN